MRCRVPPGSPSPSDRPGRRPDHLYVRLDWKAEGGSGGDTDTRGSGHIGEIDFNSAVYYKYFFTREFDPAEIYPYVTEGVGEDMWPDAYDPSVPDEIIPVKGQLTVLIPQPEVTYSCRAMPRRARTRSSARRTSTSSASARTISGFAPRRRLSPACARRTTPR